MHIYKGKPALCNTTLLPQWKYLSDAGLSIEQSVMDQNILIMNFLEEIYDVIIVEPPLRNGWFP